MELVFRFDEPTAQQYSYAMRSMLDSDPTAADLKERLLTSQVRMSALQIKHTETTAAPKTSSWLAQNPEVIVIAVGGVVFVCLGVVYVLLQQRSKKIKADEQRTYALLEESDLLAAEAEVANPSGKGKGGNKVDDSVVN